MATEFWCMASDRHPHDKGNGKPRRARCSYCGSAFVTRSVTFAVVAHRGDGRYALADAVATYERRSSAQKLCDRLNLADDAPMNGYVVRTIPT